MGSKMNQVKTETPATYDKLPAKGGRQRNATHESQEDVLIREALNILHSRMRLQGQPITSADAAKDYCRLRWSLMPDECFAVMWLDTTHGLIEACELFRGTLDSSAVYARPVVRQALEMNARACILVHNHPSGDVEPSRADLTLTRKLRDALAVVGCEVLDHLIVSGQLDRNTGECLVYSFCEFGRI